MNADDVLRAVRRHHAQAAIVPEVVIDDWDWLDHLDDGARPQRRIDALMFRSFVRTAIEIKVTTADFKRDGYEKRRPWLRVCHRFVYVVPEPLKWEVQAPIGCGLWLIDESGALTVQQRAKVNTTPEPLPQQVVQALAYRASNAYSVTGERIH